jgi:hypothetical protein
MKFFASFSENPCSPRQPRRPALEAEIDRLIYALYGLTDDKIAVVEGEK